jgi:hypothetical protein
MMVRPLKATSVVVTILLRSRLPSLVPPSQLSPPGNSADVTVKWVHHIIIPNGASRQGTDDFASYYRMFHHEDRGVMISQCSQAAATVPTAPEEFLDQFGEQFPCHESPLFSPDKYR